jgi:wyosine [tRNA(Phe)-imidazoG37] synthetase (radical SAM superfamily)
MSAEPSAQSCVYGPVPSRRLGRSLGVDLVPFKTCTFDCVYCQLGRTTHKTVRRRRWLEAAEVIAGVRDGLASEPEVIALAGSGEPTLHVGLGEVIDGVKELTSVPVAVITNGSLLGRPSLRRELAAADIVLPSLDAPDDGLFSLVNRPHASLQFAEVVRGMTAFREGYAGQMWLEILLLDGLTGTAAEVERLAALTALIAPDRIQLNTVVRPPSESLAEPVAGDRLWEFAEYFTPRAEVIAHAATASRTGVAVRADVLTLIARRPCTVDDIAAGLGVHRNAALKAAEALVAEGAAEQRRHQGGAFYAAIPAAAARSSSETEERP